MNENIIDKLSTTGKRYSFIDEQLEIVVSAKGKKTFYVKARYQNHSIHKKIGDYPTLSLKQAEKLKNEELLKFRLGIGQEEIETIDTDFSKTEFGFIFKEWFKSKLPSWRKRTKYITETVYKKYIKGNLEKLPLNAIKSPFIYSLLLKIESAVQQKKVLSIIRSAIDYAVNIGYIENNPCDRLSKALSVNDSNHFKSIPFQELDIWLIPMLSFKKNEWNRYVLFSLCSLLRPNENIGLLWGDIDYKERVITISAERMKGKKEHRIPITSQMATIINAQIKDYPNRKPTDRIFFPEHSPNYVLNRIQNIFKRKKIPTVLHGFRSTGRTWLAEQESPSLLENSIPFSVAEACLAHSEKSAVVRAYKRTDYLEQRRFAMQRWNDFISSSLEKSLNTEVIQIDDKQPKQSSFFISNSPFLSLP